MGKEFSPMRDRWERLYQFRRPNATADETVTFEVTQNDNGTWYATAKGFGCSRDHAYWSHAIRELFSAHCVSHYFPR